MPVLRERVTPDICFKLVNEITDLCKSYNSHLFITFPFNLLLLSLWCISSLEMLHTIELSYWYSSLVTSIVGGNILGLGNSVDIYAFVVENILVEPKMLPPKMYFPYYYY